MKTKKQKELIDSFLATLGEQEQTLYHELAIYLSELGYNPKRERSNIAFKHNLHNKQIVKMGSRGKKAPSPFLALRFSGCQNYSPRFAEVVDAAITKFPKRVPCCLTNTCDYCAGEPETHVYRQTFSDGEEKFHCGAYALEIPAITLEDLDELKKLIQEEHEYLLEHEVGILK